MQPPPIIKWVSSIASCPVRQSQEHEDIARISHHECGEYVLFGPLSRGFSSFPGAQILSEGNPADPKAGYGYALLVDSDMTPHRVMLTQDY